MAHYDLPLPQLREHRIESPPPPDMRQFWHDTLEQARAAGAPARVEPATQPLRSVRSFDVRFAGFGGEPIAAWLHLPAGASDDAGLTCVVGYAGYGGGRGYVHEPSVWADAGYAHLIMDTRGQGGGYGPGCTPDPHGSDPSHPGFLTKGIGSPQTYYYRRLFTDAARAVDAARTMPGVDPQRIVVAGGSQGGGLALAAAGLSEGLAGALIDVPFLCDFARAVRLTDDDPYGEIRRFLAVQRPLVTAAMTTLSYHDAAHLAAWASAPALFSVGLMDEVCPPSTVYAAINAWRGPTAVAEYEFNGHEGGGALHLARQLDWLASLP